jgi:hypothetical protein
VAEGNFAGLETAMMAREYHARAVNGRDGMKRTRMAPLVVAAFVGWLMPAHAAPPTATPSPGYDARLQEQRAASARAYEQVGPVTRSVTPHRSKRTRVH